MKYSDYIEKAGDIIIALCFIFIPIALLLNLNSLPEDALGGIGMTFFFIGVITPPSITFGFQILKKL